MIYDISKFFGVLAFICIIFAISRYILPLNIVKKYDRWGITKIIMPYILKYHKYAGILAVIFAIFHVVGLFSYLYDGEIFTKIGLAAFIMLLIVAIAGMFLKKLPIQYKKQGFKTHMFLGITVFILVLLHLAL
ncbi:MAG: hypothetical protein ACRC1R_02550 [Cetobacterium sp.]|uniref:hypothetical protein n=1 Tax=Cetobacterium sp. TaxID=2071632 RepID=UPI003F2E5E52